MIKNWTIYKIVSPSGKVYIGVTSNFKKRMNYYKNCCTRSQPLLFASLNKYGFDCHEITEIDSFISDTDYAHSKEMFWVRSYMSNTCKYKEGYGMNLTDGGQGTVGYKATMEHRKNLSEIHKANPSRGMLGKKLSPESIAKGKETTVRNRIAAGKWVGPRIKAVKDKNETKQKQSIAKKGKKPWNKGVVLSDAQKVNMHKFGKGCVSWNKGKSYDCLSDEERRMKFGSHNVGNTYNKGRKHSDAFSELMSKARLGKPNTALYKPILQYSLAGGFVGEYDSIKNASEATGCSKWTISNIAKGLMKNPDKYIFKYKQL